MRYCCNVWRGRGNEGEGTDEFKKIRNRWHILLIKGSNESFKLLSVLTFKDVPAQYCLKTAYTCSARSLTGSTTTARTWGTVLHFRLCCKEPHQHSVNRQMKYMYGYNRFIDITKQSQAQKDTWLHSWKYNVKYKGKNPRKTVHYLNYWM